MSNFHKRTTAELQAEHARIAASSDRGGPVFGIGFWNYGYARREIESELTRRGRTRPPFTPPGPPPASKPDSLMTTRQTPNNSTPTTRHLMTWPRRLTPLVAATEFVIVCEQGAAGRPLSRGV